MYINDLENELIQKGAEGIDIGMLKLYLLLYADDIVIFSNTSEGLQKGLDILSDYCQKWKLTVNIDKTKVMGVFYQETYLLLFQGNDRNCK